MTGYCVPLALPDIDPITEHELGIEKFRTRNCKSLNFFDSIQILSEMLRVRNFNIEALQEVWLKESNVRLFRGSHTMYQSGGNKHELRTAFIVMGEMQKRVIGWWRSMKSHDKNSHRWLQRSGRLIEGVQTSYRKVQLPGSRNHWDARSTNKNMGVRSTTSNIATSEDYPNIQKHKSTMFDRWTVYLLGLHRRQNILRRQHRLGLLPDNREARSKTQLSTTYGIGTHHGQPIKGAERCRRLRTKLGV